jgi:hypothetical protein
MDDAFATIANASLASDNPLVGRPMATQEESRRRPPGAPQNAA